MNKEAFSHPFKLLERSLHVGRPSNGRSVSIRCVLACPRCGQLEQVAESVCDEADGQKRDGDGLTERGKGVKQGFTCFGGEKRQRTAFMKDANVSAL
jgi:hypothetical protein